MPFTEILNDIVDKVPNAIGIIIVDFEGECVQFASRMDDHELKVIGAYQVIHFGSIDKIHATTETVITKAENLSIISMRLDDEYYISLVLGKGALISRAEYYLASRLGEIKQLM